MSIVSTAAKRYNPLAMSAGTLTETFVGRTESLDYVLAQLRSHVLAASMQHFLVTGPQGIGKTSFLRMIRLRVEADPKLDRAWACVTLPEEDYRIYGLASFFERVHEELVRGGVTAADHAMVAEESASWEAAAERLERAAKARRRKVVLFLDNFDLLLSELLPEKREHQALKRYLETTSTLLVVAASTRLVDDFADYDKPLFGHLASINLEPLAGTDVMAFFLAWASHDGWLEFQEQPSRFEPRIRAVAALTDGNPRLLLILYELLRTRDLPSASAYLEAVLDDVTPLYKDQLRNVPPKERRVLDEVLRSARASTPKDVALRVGWSQQEVGVLLQRLAGRQMLRRRQAGRRTFYEGAGGLLRLYYEMRHVHPTARRIPMLVDFLEAWYARADLKAWLNRERLPGRRCTSRCVGVPWIAEMEQQLERGDRGSAFQAFRNGLHSNPGLRHEPTGELALYILELAATGEPVLARDCIEELSKLDDETPGRLTPVALLIETMTSDDPAAVLESLQGEERGLVQVLLMELTGQSLAQMLRTLVDARAVPEDRIGAGPPAGRPEES